MLLPLFFIKLFFPQFFFNQGKILSCKLSLLFDDNFIHATNFNDIQTHTFIDTNSRQTSINLNIRF